MPCLIDHVNIVVSNLERSVDFYTRLLGFEQTRQATLEGEWIESVAGLKGVHAEVAYIQPPGGGPRIELIEYRSPAGEVLPANAMANTVGLRHLAFRVEDAWGLYERLRSEGVAFLAPPVRVPGKVVRHDEGDKSLCYFHDPDGVLLELAQYDESAPRQA